MNVIEPIEAAPVTVVALRVVEPIAGRPARVRHEHCEALEREDLDERHREPREVRALPGRAAGGRGWGGGAASPPRGRGSPAWGARGGRSTGGVGGRRTRAPGT